MTKLTKNERKALNNACERLRETRFPRYRHIKDRCQYSK